MKSLSQLIHQYGTPDILIDSFDQSSKRYAVWGFDEIFQINKKGTFLNEDLIEGDCLDIFQKTINQWKFENKKQKLACIGFLSYDFKQNIYKHLNFIEDSDCFPYVWFCKPKHIEEYNLSNCKHSNVSGGLEVLQDIMDFSNYEKQIDKIKSFLKNGDAYQINYTDFKKFKSSFNNSFDMYNTLRTKAKPKEGFYLRTNNFNILSFSPESFIKVKNNIINTMPIKGTRPRSKNNTEDNILKEALKDSIKDKAEHLMIVDLLRNDLGKICEIGSIKINELYNIKSFKTIHHMVTDIEGILKKSISEVNIIQALFPGGSITGAPKESAMKIIDYLEHNRRKIYTGMAGYIAPNGDMSFNICIRTLLGIKGMYEYGVGGGIVWDSIPQEEWNEAQQKSKILDSLIKT